MQGVHLRKYGVEAKIDFELYEVDGVDFRTDWTPAAGDVFMMRNEAAEEQVTNAGGGADLSTLVTDEGRGYSITLALEDMQAARVVVYLVDQATKAFLDKVIVIETYGNASAQHAFDLDTAKQDVNVASEDNLDFGAAKKTSLNAATTDLSAITGDKSSYKATGFAVASDVTTAHGTTDGKVDALNNFDASATPVEIRASGGTAGKNAAELVDDICDEDISKGQHNVTNSLAKKIRGIEHVTVLHEGQAQGAGGGNDTIELAESASDVNDWYRDDWVMLVEGTGVGQMHHIESYVGSTRIVTLGENWLVNPDSSTDYVIVAQSSTHIHRFEQDAKDEINAEIDSALSDYGANTVTPDAAGTAATQAEVAIELNSYGANKTTPPTVAQVRTEMETDGSQLEHLHEMTEDDAGTRRYTENSLEQAPSGAGLTSDQNTALILIKDIMEGDVTIDTTTTPWQLVIKKKSTSTEVVRKDLKDISGTNLIAIDTVIGQQLEP